LAQPCWFIEHGRMVCANIIILWYNYHWPQLETVHKGSKDVLYICIAFCYIFCSRNCFAWIKTALIIILTLALLVFCVHILCYKYTAVDVRYYQYYFSLYFSVHPQFFIVCHYPILWSALIWRENDINFTETRKW